MKSSVRNWILIGLIFLIAFALYLFRPAIIVFGYEFISGTHSSELEIVNNNKIKLPAPWIIIDTVSNRNWVGILQPKLNQGCFVSINNTGEIFFQKISPKYYSEEDSSYTIDTTKEFIALTTKNLGTVETSYYIPKMGLFFRPYIESDSLIIRQLVTDCTLKFNQK